MKHTSTHKGQGILPPSAIDKGDHTIADVMAEAKISGGVHTPSGFPLL